MQPHPVRFNTPEISNYVQHVSQLIDHKTEQKNHENSESKAIRSTQGKQQVNNQEINVPLFLHLFPTDTQSHTLICAPNFQTWLKTKMFCKHEAIQQYAALTLNKMNIWFSFFNPSKILLQHQFKEVISQSTPTEINQLLDKYRPEEQLAWKAKSQFQRGVETAISISSFILSWTARLGGHLRRLSRLQKCAWYYCSQ